MLAVCKIASFSVFPEKMFQMGFTMKEIQESLSENRYDEVCATYMLLKKDVKEVSNWKHTCYLYTCS